jgi:hypothetical protein
VGVGVAVGVGVGEGVTVGVGVDVGVGVGVGTTAWKGPLVVEPKVTDAPGASDPFHERLLAVSVPPASTAEAFQTVTAEPAQGRATLQLVMGAEPVFVTVTSVLRPVPQSLVTLMDVANADVVVGVVVGVGEGVTVGVGLAVGVGVSVGVGAGVGATVELDPIVQVPPATVHEVGVRAAPVLLPRKPNVALAPAARLVLQLGPLKL